MFSTAAPAATMNPIPFGYTGAYPFVIPPAEATAPPFRHICPVAAVHVDATFVTAPAVIVLTVESTMAISY
jgi:hypothetical protein